MSLLESPKKRNSQFYLIVFGISYCDITDHLLWFLSIKIKLNNNLDILLTQIIGEKTEQGLLKLWETKIGIQCLQLLVTGILFSLQKSNRKTNHIFRWCKSSVQGNLF